MQQLSEQLRADIQRIQDLPIVPSILEIICRTTGMGFSAVARVTGDKWIACAVKDDIGFGLKPGGELVLETTICNEIRGHGQPVVIDEVAADDQFCGHPTPKLYGFQSYISIPIFLKNGTFFGTLCAIDPRPFPLKSLKMATLFNLFADLISYHLLTQDEIRQYNHISSHTLQEPLRKMRLFTDQMADHSDLPAGSKVIVLAKKVNTLAGDFSEMIKELTDFRQLNDPKHDFEVVDLNEVVSDVLDRLRLKVAEKKAVINRGELHSVYASAAQMRQLFYHLLSNALNFTSPGTIPVIRISSNELTAAQLAARGNLNADLSYFEICIEDNGIGIARDQLDNIFDLFSRLHPRREYEGLGMGLSLSKRIVTNHGGAISLRSEPGHGSVFSILIPAGIYTSNVAPLPNSPVAETTPP